MAGRATLSTPLLVLPLVTVVLAVAAVAPAALAELVTDPAALFAEARAEDAREAADPVRLVTPAELRRDAALERVDCSAVLVPSREEASDNRDETSWVDAVAARQARRYMKRILMVDLDRLRSVERFAEEYGSRWRSKPDFEEMIAEVVVFFTAVG